MYVFFFFKQKTAYEMPLVTGVQTCALPISESLGTVISDNAFMKFMILPGARRRSASAPIRNPGVSTNMTTGILNESHNTRKLVIFSQASVSSAPPLTKGLFATRSEEHTSELQSLMRISYAVFCLKNKKQ